MIYEQPIAAVDPVRLAELTGTTKIRRFAAPIPPVVRPFLLTHQLRNVSCCDNCASGGMAVPPDYGRLRGLHGLGFTMTPDQFDMNSLQVPSAGSGNVSILQTAALGANFVPGVGQIASVTLTMLNTMLAKFQQWFGIGAGRREADIIVPVQNQLMNQLGVDTNQILTGTSTTLDQLSALYRDVWVKGVSFQEFVLMKNFTDRRASGQALNTVMPYIDGSCGYIVPIGPQATPGAQNCITWGSGTLGGAGTNGMLGAIARAIQAQGGTVPSLPDLHQSANQGIPVTNPGSIPGGGVPGVSPIFSGTIMGVSTPLAFMIGIAAIYLFSKRGAIEA